jgi:plasmid stabilization system protein ParE
MTFEFHPEALLEYQEAATWYEAQRFRLGVEFTVAVEAAVAAILADPRRYQPAGGDIRIFRMKRFPYYLFYRYLESRDHVRIVAVAHHKRRPGYWRKRGGA